MATRLSLLQQQEQQPPQQQQLQQHDEQTPSRPQQQQLMQRDMHEHECIDNNLTLLGTPVKADIHNLSSDESRASNENAPLQSTHTVQQHEMQMQKQQKLGMSIVKRRVAWTAEEDERLRDAVKQHHAKNWKRIALEFGDAKSDVQCLHRWQKVLDPHLVKGPWTPEEDAQVLELVNQYGPKKWSDIAKGLPGRIGKQCRERWHNHLNPDICKEPFTEKEDDLILETHKVVGNCWAAIAKKLNGRTDNAVKNRWNSTLKKRFVEADQIDAEKLKNRNTSSRKRRWRAANVAPLSCSPSTEKRQKVKKRQERLKQKQLQNQENLQTELIRSNAEHMLLFGTASFSDALDSCHKQQQQQQHDQCWPLFETFPDCPRSPLRVIDNILCGMSDSGIIADVDTDNMAAVSSTFAPLVESTVASCDTSQLVPAAGNRKVSSGLQQQLQQQQQQHAFEFCTAIGPSSNGNCPDMNQVGSISNPTLQVPYSASLVDCAGYANEDNIFSRSPCNGLVDFGSPTPSSPLSSREPVWFSSPPPPRLGESGRVSSNTPPLSAVPPSSVIRLQSMLSGPFTQACQHLDQDSGSANAPAAISSSTARNLSELLLMSPVPPKRK